MKSIKLKQIVFVFFISTTCYSQDYMIGKVSEIINGNTFIFYAENKNKYVVYLKDTKVVSPKAKAYLKKTILKKEIILYDVETEFFFLNAIVIYNCKLIQSDIINDDDIPCLEGNILNLEMLKYDFLEYTGSNDFLKRL